MPLFNNKNYLNGGYWVHCKPTGEITFHGCVVGISKVATPKRKEDYINDFIGTVLAHQH